MPAPRIRIGRVLPLPTSNYSPHPFNPLFLPFTTTVLPFPSLPLLFLYIFPFPPPATPPLTASLYRILHSLTGIQTGRGGRLPRNLHDALGNSDDAASFARPRRIVLLLLDASLGDRSLGFGCVSNSGADSGASFRSRRRGSGSGNFFSARFRTATAGMT